jgi:integrase
MQHGLRSALQLSTVDFDQIRRTEEIIVQSRKAPNTRTAYASSWRGFVTWCDAVGLRSLPASPQTVRDFTTWCINENYRLATVTVHICAIAHYHREAGHPSPYDETVRAHMINARRYLKEEPRGKEALTYDLLRKIVPHFPETCLGIRNRAMILLGFASGWRRSEIVALRSNDVKFVDKGVQLWQRSSKTDQIGKGRLVGIEPGKRASTCPVRALRAWVEIRGNWRGPLFPKMRPNGTMTRESLKPRAGVVKDALTSVLQKAGEDIRRFGAHSLRSGMITEASKHGASETAIKQRTGHKCSATLQKYIRPASVFDFNPLKGVL